ncbi:MAG: hypothetical protein Q7T11_00255 [Deltaproteobacteria bacterium]|nr:hypothetical protein [Deltaproteobacteria bacterium]
MAVHGNFDANEGWYANDVFLITQGEIPYRDFFYHRLPLFLYSFIPFATVTTLDWVPLRLISALYALIAGFFLNLLISRKVSRQAAWLGLALMLTNLQGIHIYATVQSYALVSLLLLMTVCLAEASGRAISDRLGVILIALVAVITQWLRYPIDYIPIAFLLYLFIVYFRRPNLVLIGILTATLGHGILLGIFWSDNFSYDLTLGMFPEWKLGSGSQNLPSNTFNTWLAYKSEWLFSGIRWFVSLIILGFPLAFMAASRIKSKTLLQNFKQERGATLAILLVLGNAAMNFLAPDGHVVQMYFVFPLMIYLTALFWGKIKPAFVPTGKTFLVAAVALVPSLFLSGHEFRLFSSELDTAIVKSIGQEIKKQCPSGGQVLTLSPLVAMASGLRILQGFEFEAYAFFEALPSGEARAHHLLNPDILLEKIRSKKACVVHLDDRLLNSAGTAARFGESRSRAFNEIEKNYRLAKTLSSPPEIFLRGPVKIYRE